MGSEAKRRRDLTRKLDRLAALARHADVHTLVLSDPASLTWLLGCRVNVPQTLDQACLDVVVEVDDDSVSLRVVTNRIEAPRLRDTELAGFDVDWTVVDWWQSRQAALPRGPGVAGDRPVAGGADVGGAVAQLRRSLSTSQQEQLRHVCRDTAAAATAAAHRLAPGMTEYAAAGALADELLIRELDPVVLLVSGADRLEAHRHPLPTGAALGDRAMLVACGRRHGLIASVTRIVSFAPLPAADQRRYRDLLEVEQVFLDASRTGTTIGDVVAKGVAAYAEHGFDAQEWHRHHQGGFSGWQPREFPAHPSSTQVIPDAAVLAWNPSGAGWKVEDTTLVGDSGAVPLVHDDAWPMLTVGGRARPDVLVV